MKDKKAYNEIDVNLGNGRINVLDDCCFEVTNKEDISEFTAGILNISKSIFEKGEGALKGDRSYFILKNVLDTLFDYVASCGMQGFTFIIEENYVDPVYRDSYYSYFSSKHFGYNRFCKRIFLFANTFDSPILDLPSSALGKDFVGSIVIRPIPGRAIGRTLLNPKYFAQDSFLRVTNYNVTIFGKRLSANAFPYSMQDGETTTCAETTILNLLDYYSRSYPEYHYLLPSDINRIVKEMGYERSLPTHGLKYEMISRVFCDSGFYPRSYSPEGMPKDKFRRILYYYVESGIPSALGLTTDDMQGKHAVIVIGHGKVNAISDRLKKMVDACYDAKSDNIVWVSDVASIVDTFCIMDDNQAPYRLEECRVSDKKQLKLSDRTIENLIVPLYKRMYLEASDASEIFKVIIASQEYGVSSLGLTSIEPALGSTDNPLVIRIFMTSSRSLRKCRDAQFAGKNEDARAWYSTTVFPRFIWVCELSTVNMYPNSVIGEIILDATSSAESYADSLILAHYPNRIFCRLPQDIERKISDTDDFHELEKWQPFFPYDSNLYPAKITQCCIDSNWYYRGQIKNLKNGQSY